MNPLFGNMGSFANMNNTPFGNFMGLMQQFNQFKNNFKGNPEEQVKQLLSSGQMSKEQFNQLAQMANMMGFKR